jgi:uncharacterized protein (TIGR02118 family)
MSGAKIVVLYPHPKDAVAFEKVYVSEHIPMAVTKLNGKTKMVASKMMSGPDGGRTAFYRMAEIHFPSLKALQDCLASAGGQETAAHAIAISSGGPPIFMIAEEHSQSFV